MTKALDYETRKQVYINLCLHARFEKLPERIQDIIGELAQGTPMHQLAKEQRITTSMIWLLRNRAFYRLGYNITENGKTRTMRIEEVARKMNL